MLRIACRQSQRSVCFVKQFATMCAIHGDCYNVCYTWTLLQYVLYVEIATMCAVRGLCYNVCHMWTLLQCVLYMDFATMCAIRGLCYIMCHMWTLLCYTWNLLHTWTLLQCVLYVDFQNQFATICVLCVLCEHQSFETRCFIISISIWIVYLGFSDQFNTCLWQNTISFGEPLGS